MILLLTFNFRPLGEPKELKTKFDAIFEVEKFVKVMDGIKKSTKDFVNIMYLILSKLEFAGN